MATKAKGTEQQAGLFVVVGVGGSVLGNPDQDKN
jgi:hypothetical protein